MPNQVEGERRDMAVWPLTVFYEPYCQPVYFGAHEPLVHVEFLSEQEADLEEAEHVRGDVAEVHFCIVIRQSSRSRASTAND